MYKRLKKKEKILYLLFLHLRARKNKVICVNCNLNTAFVVSATNTTECKTLHEGDLIAHEFGGIAKYDDLQWFGDFDLLWSRYNYTLTSLIVRYRLFNVSDDDKKLGIFMGWEIFSSRGCDTSEGCHAKHINLAGNWKSNQNFSHVSSHNRLPWPWSVLREVLSRGRCDFCRVVGVLIIVLVGWICIQEK